LPRRIIDSKPTTTSEAKRTLERVKGEELGEFQRRTLDYAAKFSRIPPPKAEKLVRELTDRYQMDRKDAIQVVNSMPHHIEELRSILTVKGRIITGSQLDEILKLLNGYREE
jgi:DNA-directed RNA polymerase subunit F